MTCIFEDIYNNDLDESMLILMLLGALPGYNSKYGDGGDFLKTYDSVVDFFERYTKKVLLTSSLFVRHHIAHKK